eukprot:scaffold92880_cov67-Attheya_sp.AAC.2
MDAFVSNLSYDTPRAKSRSRRECSRALGAIPQNLSDAIMRIDRQSGGNPDPVEDNPSNAREAVHANTWERSARPSCALLRWAA